MATAAPDHLYRILYLRREYALILARAQLQTEEQCRAHDRPPSSASSDAQDVELHDTPSVDDVRDVLLLPPVDETARVPWAPEADSAAAFMSRQQAWSGLVTVRHPSSPWYGGCFPFTAIFPAHYPFECPVVWLNVPLRSHPLLQHWTRMRRARSVSAARLSAEDCAGSAPQHRHHDTSRSSSSSNAAAAGSTAAYDASAGAFVAFDEVYYKLDPMRVSVMARLLQLIKTLFYPALWPAAWRRQITVARAGAEASSEDESGDDDGLHVSLVDRVLAQQDVQRRGATQEVVLGTPYVSFLCNEVTQYFLGALQEASEASVQGGAPRDEAGRVWAEWYGRRVLPHMLRLQ